MNIKALEDPEGFEKELTKFIQEWIGYEIHHTTYASFDLEGEPMFKGALPSAKISLHLVASYLPPQN